MAEITLSGVKRNLSKANEYLLGWWRDQRLSEDKRFDFELALEELFINAVTHGDMQSNASRVVQISLAVEKKPQTATVSMRISYEGPMFNPLTVATPNTHPTVEKRSLGGLGIHLTVSLMDRVDHEFSDGLNVTSVTKTFDHAL